jgi:hypothetical protein
VGRASQRQQQNTYELKESLYQQLCSCEFNPELRSSALGRSSITAITRDVGDHGDFLPP